MKRNELLGTIVFTLLVGSIIGSVSGFNSGLQAAYSATGTQNSLSEDWIETESANFSKYYLDDTNITDRLTGDWGSTNLATTGTISTADLNLTSDIYYNAENRTDLIANPSSSEQFIIEKDGSTYTATNGTTGQIDFSGTNGSDVFLDVLTAMTDGGGIHFGLGDFDLGYDIAIPEKNWYIITGEGTASSGYNMETTGGTILNFNSARFVDGGDGWTYKVHLKNLGILFEGTYSDSPWDMPDTLLHMDNVYIKADCTIPNGTSSYFMEIGSAGPTGSTYRWNNVRWFDSRNIGGTNEGWDTKFVYLYTESAILDGCGLTTQVGEFENSTSFMSLPIVSWVTIRNFVIFTDDTFDDNNRQYKYMFYFGAGTANLILDNVQLLDSDDIATAHFQAGTNGYLWVTLRNHPVVAEGGYIPMDVSTSGSGKISFISDWFVTPDNKGATSNTWDYVTLGETVGVAGIVYLTSDGDWNNTDADVEATGQGLLGFCPRGGNAADTRRIAYSGWIRDDTWTFTPGEQIWLSTSTGALTGTVPSGSNDVVRLVGHAVTADLVWLHPDNYYTVVP